MSYAWPTLSISLSCSLFGADRQETRQKIGTTIASNNFSNWSRPSWEAPLLYLCFITQLDSTFPIPFGVLAITPLLLLHFINICKTCARKCVPCSQLWMRKWKNQTIYYIYLYHSIRSLQKPIPYLLFSLWWH